MTLKRLILVCIFFYEGLLIIPFVSIAAFYMLAGKLAIIGVMLHVFAFLILRGEQTKAPWAIGIVAHALSWVPIVGWALHVVTFIGYMFAMKGKTARYGTFMRDSFKRGGYGVPHPASKKAKVHDAEIVD